MIEIQNEIPLYWMLGILTFIICGGIWYTYVVYFKKKPEK